MDHTSAPSHIGPRTPRKTRRSRFWTLPRARSLSQSFFAAAFVVILLTSSVVKAQPSLVHRIFFAFDPLLFLSEALATRALPAALPYALAAVLLAVVLGRFFCGWMCPLGALNHLASATAARLGFAVTRVGPRVAKLRYVALASVVVLAAGGSQLGTLIDPMSLLSRGLATFAFPAAGLFLAGSDVSLDPPPAIGSAPPLAQSPAPDHPGHGVSRPMAAGVGVAILLLAILAANLVRRRFFCASLCPLGALYGLVARTGLWRVRRGADCSDCGLCSVSCSTSDGPGTTAAPQDCLSCFNCVAACPSDAVAIGIEARPLQPARSVDLGRRHAVVGIASGIAFAAMVKITPAAAATVRRFMRPPGARSESDFLARCVRCGQCVQACPTGFVQSAGLDADLEGLWTPVVDASLGYCAWECTQCTRVCPSGAIRPLSLADKQQFKIGTAVVDRNRCFTHTDGIACTVCADRCPIPERAIRFRDVETWSFRGEKVKVAQIYVEPSLCTGCGICEHVCPRADGPGIFVTCEDEQRENPFDTL